MSYASMEGVTIVIAFIKQMFNKREFMSTNRPIYYVNKRRLLVVTVYDWLSNLGHWTRGLG